jgi:hypothetical protein
MRKWIVRLLVAVVLTWVGVLAWVYYIMHLPPAQFAKRFANLPPATMMAMPFESLWMRARAGSLAVGDAAPDFALSKLDKSGQVKLSDLRGKPVLLVFGSYT